MVLRICVCALYTIILAYCVVGLTGTPYGNRTGSRWMSGETNRVLPIGIHGKGGKQIYTLGRLPTHPCRALGAAAIGKNIGKSFLCRYHGRTSI